MLFYFSCPATPSLYSSDADYSRLLLTIALSLRLRRRSNSANTDIIIMFQLRCKCPSSTLNHQNPAPTTPRSSAPTDLSPTPRRWAISKPCLLPPANLASLGRQACQMGKPPPLETPSPTSHSYAP